MMTIAISFGKWGGFYVYKGWTKRLCLGFVAITFFPRDIDEIFLTLVPKAAIDPVVRGKAK